MNGTYFQQVSQQQQQEHRPVRTLPPSLEHSVAHSPPPPSLPHPTPHATPCNPRSLTSVDMGRSFDAPTTPSSLTAAVAAADAPASGVAAASTTTATATDNQPQQLQQQQLSVADKQLLDKLVGILTKEGKRSRARRILLDAMHIIKQQVAAPSSSSSSSSSTN